MEAEFKEFIAQIKRDNEAKGYRRAVRDLRKEFNDLINRLLAENVRLPAAKRKGIEPSRRRRRGRAGSVQERVFEVIKETPGLRGVEIIEKLGATGSPPSERTARTALWRLKKATRIEQKDGGWYPVNQG